MIYLKSMGRTRKTLLEKIEDGRNPDRLTTGKRFEINVQPPVRLLKGEMQIWNEVISHLNEAGAGMNIDARLICAYCKDVVMLDMLQEQMKKAVASKNDDAGNEVKRLSTVINGCHQRIFQNQQSLAIGALNRRKISHFQDHIDDILASTDSADPFKDLLT